MNARYGSTRTACRLAAACLLAATAAVAPAPVRAQWAAQGGGPGHEFGNAVTVDAEGNTFATGQFQGETVFGPFTLISEGGADLFVVKYGPSGEVLWARSAGGGTGWDDSEAGLGVAVDAGGNAYVTGYFTRGAAFGPFTFTGDGGFLAKYSPGGEVLWVERIGTNEGTSGAEVAVDAAGNPHVTGSFAGTVAFGPYVLTSAGRLDVFVAKYAPGGEVLWAARAGGGDLDSGAGISVDAAGNAFITGGFWGTAAFGPYVLTSAGRSDIFVAKYGPDGSVLWAHRAGGPYNGFLYSGDWGLSVAADVGGNAYVSGFFVETADFGPFTLTSAGGSDAFVAKYSPTGEVLWARNGGGSADEMGRGVAAGPDGNAFVVGYFSGTATFGPHTLVSAGSADVFLAEYAPDGTVLGAWRAGGEALGTGYGDQGYAVAVDAAGVPHITGLFIATATFGSSTLTSAGETDVFVARFEPDPAVVVAAVPLDPPVVVPAAGGAFRFALTLTNATEEPQTFQAWSAAEGPVSREPVLGPQAVTLPPGATVTRTLTQRVPPNAPAGAYTYYVRLGASDGSPVAVSSFTFAKQAGVADAAALAAGDGWSAHGWEGVAMGTAAGLPGAVALSGVSPNPFTRRTTVTLEVGEAQHVRAEVFDGLGRRVTVLLDGEVEAGAHALVFDGSALPAGVYVVRVTGGTRSATRRVTLVR